MLNILTRNSKTTEGKVCIYFTLGTLGYRLFAECTYVPVLCQLRIKTLPSSTPDDHLMKQEIGRAQNSFKQIFVGNKRKTLLRITFSGFILGR